MFDKLDDDDKLHELKKLHDKAYNHNQVTRERAADDMVFYHVTQWDDNLLGESQLAYRGEFNILRKAGRQILADLRSNPVQVDFHPKDETRDDDAELMDGLYRSSARNNTSIEAFDNASAETVVCGVGAWELFTEYESNRAGDNRQVIRRKPIFEANNSVYWDPNAKLADKSDAKYVSILTAYSEDGYKKLVEELTGEEDVDVCESSFKFPEHSYAFPWWSEDKKIYVTSFYTKKKVKDKHVTLMDPFGLEQTLRADEIEEVMDDLIDSGYEVVSEKEIDRWEITKYIASGERILSEEVIAGQCIPVVPSYGERAFVEGEEHYEGVTRLAKDPQRLRNFQMSYLADIVSRSPRPKPIFTQEQIGGYEYMYEENGADNNYPYLLQHRYDSNGNENPIGPAVMPEQPMPQALIASMELSRQAVEDVANPGLPQDIADPDLSGKAVYALQARLDQQSIVYQQNMKHSKRRDAEIFASMAAEVYDAPRTVNITLPDGTQKKAQIMQAVIDQETGEPVTLNDVTNSEFEVYADIGPSYQTQKEQTLDRLDGMIQAMPPGDPMRNILMLKAMVLMPGVDFEDVREYARKQLVLQGIREPETPEEEQLLMQAQQNQQPDPNMVLAQAEQMKGQADLMREQRETMKAQYEIQNNQAKTQIDAFEAQTDRMDTQIDAQKAGAEINNKRIDAMGKQLENIRKQQEIASHPTAMTNEQLFNQIMRGE